MLDKLINELTKDNIKFRNRPGKFPSEANTKRFRRELKDIKLPEKYDESTRKKLSKIDKLISEREKKEREYKNAMSGALRAIRERNP